jgi:hypothetical protein
VLLPVAYLPLVAVTTDHFLFPAKFPELLTFPDCLKFFIQDVTYGIEGEAATGSHFTLQIYIEVIIESQAVPP